MIQMSSPSRRMEEDAIALGPAEYKEPTGFSENFNYAAQQFIAEDMSVSRLINSGNIVDRNKRITEAVMEGNNLGPAANFYDLGNGEFDYGSMAEFIRANTDILDIKTDAELKLETKEFADNLRQEAQEVSSRSTKMGALGQFGGTAVMAMSDPIYLPTYFVGFGAAARSATMLSRVGKVALYTGAVEGVAEAVNQSVNVMSWKQDLGLDYGVVEAAKTVAITALGSAALGGAITSVAEISTKAISKGLGKQLKDIQATDIATKEVVADVQDLKKFMDSSPDPNMPITDHMQKLYDVETTLLERGPLEADDPGARILTPEEEKLQTQDLEARGADMAEVKALDAEEMTIEQAMIDCRMI